MKKVSAPSEDLIRFLAVYDLSVSELGLKLREMVLSEAPTATELIYDAYSAVAIAFTFTKRLKEAFCHIAVYSKHVNLGFNHGASLPDPDGVLAGSGKQIRHIKVGNADDLANPQLRHFLKLAIQRAKSECVVPSKKGATAIVKATKGAKRRPQKGQAK